MKKEKIIVLTIYIVALFTPAFRQDYSKFWFGIELLIFGWLTLYVVSFMTIAWISNLLFFSCFFIKKRKLNFIISLLTFLFSIPALFIRDIPDVSGHNYVKPTLGVFIWILAFAVNTFFAFKKYKENLNP
jgi:hypothetical protein